jgi:capsular exopolysaccharide synthesis family protein
MAEKKAEMEKVKSTDLVVPEELETISPRYPSLAGVTAAGPGGYGYGNYAPEEDKVHLRELWRIIRRRKWLIASIALIITTLMTIEMYRTRSTYEASALVEVGKDSAVLNTPGTFQVGEEFDPFYQVNIKTKLLFLKSQPLAEDAVTREKLYNNPNFLGESGKKSIKEALSLIWARLSFQPPPEQKPQTVKLAPADDVEFASSPEERSELLKPYASMVLGGLDATQIRDTRAIRITYTHTDPKIAAQVANAVAKSFVDSNLDKKKSKFEHTAEWLDEAMRRLKGEVEKLEKQKEEYTRGHKIYDTGGNNATLTTETLSALNKQALEVEKDTFTKRLLYEEVKAGRVNELAGEFADMVYKSAPRLLELNRQLKDLETKRAALDAKYGDEYPDVIENKQQIAEVKLQIAAATRALEQKLQSDYERAVKNEQEVKKNLEATKTEAVGQNEAAVGLNVIQQELETKRRLYSDYLQKSSQANLQVEEQQNNLRIIQAAQAPGAPAGPNRFRNILLALIVSLGLGVGLAFVLEYMDNTVKTVEDVTRYTQLPALSIIPAVSSGSSRLLLKAKGKELQTTNGAGTLSKQLMVLEPRSSGAEAYRVLRTSILLSTAGQPPKRILFTSGQPSEGKTTTSANTAVSLAQLGASVLVIDCDMRRPSLHKIFGIDHTQGLSTYLSRNVDIDKLIQKLPVPNVSVLPSGAIPPNPAELISSERMREMLAMLSERYDHILIDSPPLINVTDPVILSTMVDGVILVVHGGKSTRDVVRRARHELTAVGAKVFGIVLNNVDLRKDGYSDYYYNRYYSGYGKEDKKS